MLRRERRVEGGLPICAQHCMGRAMTVVAEDQMADIVGNLHSWKTGRIVYVSDKWVGMGEALAY